MRNIPTLSKEENVQTPSPQENSEEDSHKNTTKDKQKQTRAKTQQVATATTQNTTLRETATTQNATQQVTATTQNTTQQVTATTQNTTQQETATTQNTTQQETATTQNTSQKTQTRITPNILKEGNLSEISDENETHKHKEQQQQQKTIKRNLTTCSSCNSSFLQSPGKVWRIKCILPNRDGTMCHRKYFNQYTQKVAARKLRVAQPISTTWSYALDPQVQRWTGRVASKPTATTAMVRYDEHKSRLFPFPPTDIRIRIRSVQSTTDKPSHAQFVCNATRCARVGAHIFATFSRPDNTTLSLNGVVVETMGPVIRVKYWGFRKALYFPPPHTSNLSVLKVIFTDTHPQDEIPAPSGLPATHLDTEEGVDKERLGTTPGPRCDTRLDPQEPEQHVYLEANDTQSQDRPEGAMRNGRPPKQHPPVPRRMKLATINGRGMRSAKFDALCLRGNANNISFFAVTDTKRTATAPPLFLSRKWSIYEAPATDAGHYGVALMMRAPLTSSVRGEKILFPHRVLAVEMEGCNVIVVYAPCCTNPGAHAAVLSAIADHIKDLDPHKPLVVAGDFNARLRSQFAPDNLSLRRVSEQFDDFILSNHLHAANVNFPGKRNQPTHKYGGTLDYVLVRKCFQSSVHDVTVTTAPFITDHRMVTATLAVKWMTSEAREARFFSVRSPDLSQLREENVAKKFISDVRTSMLALPTVMRVELNHDTATLADILSKVPLIDAHHVFSTAVRSAAQQLPRAPMPFRMRDRTDDPALRNLLAIQNEHRVLTHDELLVALSMKRDEQRNGIMKAFADAFKKKPKEAWSLILRPRKAATQRMPAKSNAERLGKYHVHFSKLFDTPDNGCPATGESVRTATIWRSGPFTLHELVAGISSLQNNKSTGIDDIPNEILKLAELRPALLVLLNVMFVHGTVTQDQITSLLVPLPKKGDLSDAGNWRGISLMPHLTKLYDRLLMHRLRDAIDDLLHASQNGFRQNRGCPQHAMTLSLLADVARTQDYPLHGCFVDFMKAFDSVHWSAVKRELVHWNAPEDFISGVMRIMEGHVLRVRCESELSEPIHVKAGVLQGDTLAPYLFVMVMDSILRRLPTECGILLTKADTKVTTARQLSNWEKAGKPTGEKRLTSLAFADDALLFSHTAPGLQTILHTFESVAREVGLRINMGKAKTERFVIGDEPGTVTLLSGAAVPVVPTYRYLGVHVLDYDTDLAARKGKAWAVILKFHDVWKSTAPRDTKRILFRVLVEPILTYGLCEFALTKTRATLLDAMYGRMLRFALGLPSTAYTHSQGDYTVSSEDVYGDVPFLSSTLRVQRLRMLGRAVAHVERTKHMGDRKAVHPVLEVLAAPLGDLFGKRPWKRRIRPDGQQRAPRTTLLQSLARDLGVETGAHIIHLLHPRSCEQTLDSTLQNLQDARWAEIFHRRLRRST
jgi:exonuclease III